MLLFLVAIASALFRWRHGEAPRQVVRSTGLFIFVVAQAAIGLAVIDDTWPLTGYPMYAYRPDAEPVLEDLVFIGITRDGKTIEVPPPAVYPDANDLTPRSLAAMRGPATAPRLTKGFFDYYNAAEPDPQKQLASLRVSVRTRQWNADHKLISDETQAIAAYP